MNTKLKALVLATSVLLTACATTGSPNGPYGNTSNSNSTSYSIGYSEYGGVYGGLSGGTYNVTPAPGTHVHTHFSGCGHPVYVYRPYYYGAPITVVPPGAICYTCRGRVVSDPYLHARQPLPWEGHH